MKLNYFKWLFVCLLITTCHFFAGAQGQINKPLSGADFAKVQINKPLSEADFAKVQEILKGTNLGSLEGIVIDKNGTSKKVALGKGGTVAFLDNFIVINKGKSGLSADKVQQLGALGKKYQKNPVGFQRGQLIIDQPMSSQDVSKVKSILDDVPNNNYHLDVNVKGQNRSIISGNKKHSFTNVQQLGTFRGPKGGTVAFADNFIVINKGKTGLSADKIKQLEKIIIKH